MGGASGHIKAHGLSLFPHQRKFRTEGLLGRHAFAMLGRTLNLKFGVKLWNPNCSPLTSDHIYIKYTIIIFSEKGGRGGGQATTGLVEIQSHALNKNA